MPLRISLRIFNFPVKDDNLMQVLQIVSTYTFSQLTPLTRHLDFHDWEVIEQTTFWEYYSELKRKAEIV